MISCLHLDHNEVKLRINKKKETTEKKKNTWQLNSTF